MHWRRLGICGALALGLATGVACGTEEAPVPDGSWSQAGARERERDAAANEAPVIDSLRIDPDEPASGDEVRALVRTSDADGDSVKVGFVWSIDGRTLEEGGAIFELTEVSRGQRLQVVATASDGLDESETASATAVVRNRRPTITGLELEPGGETPLGTPIVARPRAEDPDGDELEYRFEWTVNGRVVPAKGPRLETAELRRKDSIQVRVWAEDDDAESAPVYSQVVEVGNARPEIVSAPGGLDPDGVFRYAIAVRDPDGDRSFRFYLSKGPEGMRVDPITGEVTWRPSHRHAGVHPVELEVRDPRGSSVTQSFELTVASGGPRPVPAAVR